MATRSLRPPLKSTTFDAVQADGTVVVSNEWYDWALNIVQLVVSIQTQIDEQTTDNTTQDVTINDLLTEDVSVFAPRMTPTITGGCDALVAIEFAPTQPNFHALPFPAGVDTSADFHAMLPFFWARKTFQLWVYWGHGGGGTAWDTSWELVANTTYDNESVILDFVDGIVVNDTGGVPGNLYIAQAAGVPISSYENEEGSLVSMRITRRGTSAEDTMDIPAYLLAVRFVLEGNAIVAPLTDQYWDNVVLLVQGGTAASTTIDDYSKYQDTTTISNYASFNASHQVFENNSIQSTTISSAVNKFYSNGNASKFGRATGSQWTIECWAYIGTLTANSPAGFFFAWGNSTNGPILRLGVAGTTPKVWLRNGTDAAVATADITTGALHYFQINVDGTSYTVDLDGVEIYSGTNSWWVNSGGEYYFYAAAEGSTGSATGPTTEIWTSPLRVTRGVLRARGTVPATEFPVGGAWLVDSDSSTTTTVSSDGRTFTYTPTGSTFAAAWVRAHAARTGKRYWEFSIDGPTAGDTFIGLIAQAEFVSIGGNKEYPQNIFGESFWGIHNGGPFTSVGLMTNGTHSGNASYAFTTGDVIGVAVDFATGNVWFSKNGAWIVGDPVAGTSPTFSGLSAALDPLVTFYNQSPAVLGVTANFTAAQFATPAPVGFVSLNT